MEIESAGGRSAISNSQAGNADSTASPSMIGRCLPGSDSSTNGNAHEHLPASWPLERWLLVRLLAALGNPKVHVELWDGARLGEGSVGSILIRSRSMLWRLLLSPQFEFAEGYSDGKIEVEGPLVNVMVALFQTWARRATRGLFGHWINRTARRRSHSVAASRSSVYHHYDIGNDFYRLWLDERMQYTCAYFAEPQATLEAAQLAKIDHVCRKLRLKPGERVVEAGCGWGWLAVHMAEKYGVTVRAYNLSREQVAYARQSAQSRGLAQRVEFIEDDYRNATGTCDKFVSVGMLEHVGPENYTALGRLIDRLLTPCGIGLIHSIGQNRPEPLDPWTSTRIFPGAYPPALSEMARIFEPVGFSVLDVENLRLHYAQTLQHWLERFERAAGEISNMFDLRFIRMWRMYLSASIATFQTGGLQLFQVVFARESNNEIPRTREHLYGHL
jgi:cyclopropane-fatty-acyl-phospholipid synthase